MSSETSRALLQHQAGADVEIINLPPETWAYLARQAVLGRQEAGAALEDPFDQLTEIIARAGIRKVGQPRAHFHYRDGEYVGFEIGLPIDPNDVKAAREHGLAAGPADPGHALVHIHRGPYGRLHEAYHAMEKNLVAQCLKGRGDLWEVYLNDPDECSASELLTQIVWPVDDAHV